MSPTKWLSPGSEKASGRGRQADNEWRSVTSQLDIFKAPPRWLPAGFDEAKLTTEEGRISQTQP
jgi:hypothetical protein